MPQCAEAHLKQPRISKFLQVRIPGDPSLSGRGGKGTEGEAGFAEGELAYLPLSHLVAMPL